MLPIALAALLPDIIKSGFDLFDKKFQTDAEKDEAKRMFLADTQKQVQNIWEQEQEHITKRHENDMSSDSWLSKNIRPLVLIYLMGLFTYAFVASVGPEILALLKELMMTVFVFYFGARGLEKVAKIAANVINKPS